MPPTPRILAIDDTPANLMTLGAVLANEFELQIATSGAQGLAQAESRPPDLILLDIMMPEMDGYEVCRRLKAHPELKQVPVIFITALGDAEAECAGLALGAADYLSKPINVELARLRIRNLLERESLRKEVENHRDQLEAKVAERTVALVIAKEAAEAANRAKTAFLATMSHELRTPLNHVMGMTMLATRLATQPKQADYLGKSKQAAERLLGIVTHVLDVAKLEAKRLPLEAVDFCPGEIFAALENSFSRDAASRQLMLRFTLDPALANCKLQGDPARVQQIVHTLIDNALKFTPAGQVDVRARLGTGDARQVRLQIEVEDTGIGIAPEDMPHIFDTFFQQDASSTREYGGTGVGLPICKSLVECMHGSLQVRSELHRGSLFSVDLRLPASPHSAHRPSPAENALDSLLRQPPGAQVALVEADSVMRAVLSFMLEDAGLLPVIVPPETLEQRLASEPCRWILLNPDLPGLDAPGLISRLRQQPATAAIPVLLLSDETFSETIQQAMAAGAQGHLTHPVEPNNLYSMLHRFMTPAAIVGR